MVIQCELDSDRVDDNKYHFVIDKRLKMNRIIGYNNVLMFEIGVYMKANVDQ